MDKKEFAVLDVLCVIISDNEYKIMECNEALSLLPSDIKITNEELIDIIARLKDQGLVKYTYFNEDDMEYCITVLAKGRKTLAEWQGVIEAEKKKNEAAQQLEKLGERYAVEAEELEREHKTKEESYKATVASLEQRLIEQKNNYLKIIDNLQAELDAQKSKDNIEKNRLEKKRDEDLRNAKLHYEQEKKNIISGYTSSALQAKEKYEKQLAEYREQLEIAREDIEEKSVQIEGLTLKIEELQQQQNEINQQLEATKAEYQQQEAGKYAKQGEENVQLTLQVTELSAEKADLITELEKVNKELATTREKVWGYQADIESLKDELNQLQKAKNAEKDEYNRKIIVLTAERDRAEMQLSRKGVKTVAVQEQVQVQEQETENTPAVVSADDEIITRQLTRLISNEDRTDLELYKKKIGGYAFWGGLFGGLCCLIAIIVILLVK